jgi:predicted transcriptional regulator
MSESINYVKLAADVVSAYLSNNTVAAGDIPALIADIHQALFVAAEGKVEPKVEALVPAVSIRKSINPDFIVCLEDGRKFKSLKRHLRTQYGISPDDYRAKWGLPADYPMVAPNYAAARSALAKEMGLGQKRRKKAAPAPVAPPKKGRSKKAA